MSGVISDNTVRSSGVVAPLSAATLDANNPANNTNPTDGLGTKWINTTSGQMFICTDATTDANVWQGQTGGVINYSRGIWAGGEIDGISATNKIQYIEISTPGNSTDFGDLTEATMAQGSSSNGTTGRGITGGRVTNLLMNYFTIGTPGNATAGGEITHRRWYCAAVSNATDDRVCWGGGDQVNVGAGHYSDIIDYTTISTAANATDFGNISADHKTNNSGYDNGTDGRGCFGGGWTPGVYSANIAYITIGTPGNSTNFSTLSVNRRQGGGTSNGTGNRGIQFGGVAASDGAKTNVIDYFTITSTATAVDFGNLSEIASMNAPNQMSSGLGQRGVCVLGNVAAGSSNVMEYITIDTPSNSTDFGDILDDMGSGTGCSNAFG